VNEYCTIKVSGARQTGHTTSIYRISLEIDSWLISPKKQMNDHFKGNFPDNRVREFFTFRTDLKDVMRETTLPELIFVDCSVFLSNTKREELLDLISKSIDIQKKICVAFIQ
jgi:hypothetical protein